MADLTDPIIGMLRDMDPSEARDVALRLISPEKTRYERDKKAFQESRQKFLARLELLRPFIGDEVIGIEELPLDELEEPVKANVNDKHHKTRVQKVWDALSDGRAKTALEIAEETGLSPQDAKAPLYNSKMKMLVERIGKGRKVAFRLKPNAKPPWDEKPKFSQMIKTVLAQNPQGLTYAELIERLGHVAESLGNGILRYGPLSSNLYGIIHNQQEGTFDKATGRYKLNKPESVQQVPIPTRDEVKKRRHPKLDTILEHFKKNKNQWTTIEEFAEILGIAKIFVVDAFEMHEDLFETGRVGREKAFRMKKKTT